MSIKNGKHYLHPSLLDRAVHVTVIGAGGTGSHVVSDLAVLHQSMLDLGHPEGLRVTVVDFDEVSPANIGRAKFFSADVGQNKAQVLVNRINMCYGFEFQAKSQKLGAKSDLYQPDIIIGCVDTRESRRAIANAKTKEGAYWLDLGNGAFDGQVILGQMKEKHLRVVTGTQALRLPCVTDLYPEMLNAKDDPKDAGPSCSRAEALRKQSAFVNKTAALHGVSMLASLFRDGYIDHHAVFFNVSTGKSRTLACDPEVWKRFGYTT